MAVRVVGFSAYFYGVYHSAGDSYGQNLSGAL
jgi:hypothetical protein